MKLKESFKKKDINMFLVVLLTLLIPSIYSTFRIHLLGEIPNEWGVNIASQIQWLDIFFEVIRESMLLPLFFIIGLAGQDMDEFTNKVKTGLITSSIIYLFFAILIIFNVENILILMSKNDLITETASYVKLETIGLCIATISAFINIVLISSGSERSIFKLLVLKMASSLILDTWLLGNFKYSINIGVNGVAISNIISGLIVVIIGIVFLKKEGINILKKSKLSFSWQRKWFKIGSISGVESLVRNLFFVFMVVRMVNMVQAQGLFWISNNFIWGWLLLPVLALGEVTKKNVSRDNNSYEEELRKGFMLTSLFIIIWVVTVPLWKWFIANVMNVEEFAEVYRVVAVSLVFYVAFAYNNVIDSIFYGLGRTDLMLWQSILTNIIVYGIAFVLYVSGAWMPTLISIAILFGIGVLFDSILTLIMYVYMNKGGKLIRK